MGEKATTLTIFAIPKPFLGHTGVIQRNAVRSWLALRPRCEIVLIGDEPGVAECARDFGVRHIRAVARSEYGTPLLHDAFARVEATARFPYLCYINADVILPSAFTDCVSELGLKRFLMIGQRLTVTVDEDLELSDPAGVRRIEHEAAAHGVLDAPYGIDYFAFPQRMLGPLPPFAVGRPGWDNWMIYQARRLGLPVVDASERIMVIHQDHSYDHVPQRSGDRWEGPEANANRDLVAEQTLHFTVRAATWRLTQNGLEKRRWWSQRDRFDLWETAAVLHPRARRPLAVANFFWRRWDRRLVALVEAALSAGRGTHTSGDGASPDAP
jgi:hypothetical protein